MLFVIYKTPSKVTIMGLLGICLFWLVSGLFLRDTKYWLIVLFAGLLSLVILFFQSFASAFASTITVFEDRIEATTFVGGVISIPLDTIDWDRTELSSTGLSIVPLAGEQIHLSTTEYSQRDIARLSHFLGLAATGWYEEL